MTESSTGNVDKTWLVPRKVTKLQSFSKSSWNIRLEMSFSANFLVLPSSRNLFHSNRQNLSWTSSSLGLRTSALEGKTFYHCFDSALAADLHEKSLGIFSSHAGAIAGAGHLWEHKPNLQQDDLKQYLSAKLHYTRNPLQGRWQRC